MERADPVTKAGLVAKVSNEPITEDLTVEPTPKTETPSFEAAYRRLQEIVQQLEKGEQNLESSLKHFEEGVQLTRVCQTSLQAAELKVQQLLRVGVDGQAETKPFNPT